MRFLKQLTPEWTAAGARALGAVDLGMAQALLEVTINPTIELPGLTQYWETDSWRAQIESCEHQDSGERSSDPKETDPDLPVRVQESLVEAWVGGGLQGWGRWCKSACMGPFERGHHYLHYFHHSLASGQTTGRKHSPIYQQKIGLKIS